MSATSLNFSDDSGRLATPFSSTLGTGSATGPHIDRVVHAGPGLPTSSGPSVAAAAALARRVAADPTRWRDLVRYGQGDERWYARLDVDPEHEVWLISWLPGQETGLHDHGEALGAFAVIQGALTETTLAPDVVPGTVRRVRRRFAAGQVRGFGYEHIHDVGNADGQPAISVHAYAPSLTAMTRYSLVENRLTILSSDRAGVDW
jgi:predicted metal-dependent enzyme (double-stranded beta helix superfamily)